MTCYPSLDDIPESDPPEAYSYDTLTGLWCPPGEDAPITVVPGRVFQSAVDPATLAFTLRIGDQWYDGVDRFVWVAPGLWAEAVAAPTIQGALPAGELGIFASTVFTVGWASYLPVRITADTPVNRVGLVVVTAVGNISAGVCADVVGPAPGALLSSSGAVACPAAGIREVAVPDVVLTPGRYWIGLSFSSATCQVRYVEVNGGVVDPVSVTAVVPRFKNGSAHPLPDPAPATATTTTAVTCWLNHVP